MANVADKVIVTNRSALKAKYGTSMASLDAAITRLIASDSSRGIATVEIDISDAHAMSAVGDAAVKSSQDQNGAKNAVDAIYRASTPDYILILGAGDVVPLQDLDNPLYEPDVDDDRTIPSDLPYACDAPYSKDPTRFMGPGRVVGRVPNIPKDTSPDFLITAIDHAAKLTPRDSQNYKKYFGLTADVWRRSTANSLRAVFGTSRGMFASPSDGPGWTPNQLDPLSHFINCHGSPADPQFYGQRASSYPISHQTRVVSGNIKPGTVTTAECCYGAELYDPKRRDYGICIAYVKDGAAAFVGSTTIAYGPATTNNYADLICQYFFNKILQGASSGRALLEARQQYVLSKRHMDPTSVKTLAQFLLLGDPSGQPVQREEPVEKSVLAKAMRYAPDGPKVRRLALSVAGAQLASNTPIPVRVESGPGPHAKAFKPHAPNLDFEGFRKMSSFILEPPSRKEHPGGTAKAMKAPDSVVKFHLYGRRTEVKDVPGLKEIELILATEENEEVVDVERCMSKGRLIDEAQRPSDREGDREGDEV